MLRKSLVYGPFRNRYVSCGKYWDGKMINAVENLFEEGKIPTPKEIVKCVEAYMNSFQEKC